MPFFGNALQNSSFVKLLCVTTVSLDIPLEGMEILCCRRDVRVVFRLSWLLALPRRPFVGPPGARFPVSGLPFPVATAAASVSPSGFLYLYKDINRYRLKQYIISIGNLYVVYLYICRYKDKKHIENRGERGCGSVAGMCEGAWRGSAGLGFAHYMFISTYNYIKICLYVFM